jgi:uncharacterized membrane protein HdeD (DUF308 family)
MRIFAAKKEMKLLQSSIFRAVSSIVIGFLLLKYPDHSVTWLTMAIGILFLLSGIIALISYWNARRHANEYTITDAHGNVINGTQPGFPLVGIGSLLLGLTLVINPTLFVHWLMYILGAMLILGGINQLIILVATRRYGYIGAFFWIAPFLIIIAGIFIFIKPMESAELPMIILGWCMLLYGVTEMINSIMVYSLRRKLKKMQEAAEAGVVAEEIKDEPQQEQSQIPVITEKQPQEEIVEEVSETDIIVEEE